MEVVEEGKTRTAAGLAEVPEDMRTGRRAVVVAGGNVEEDKVPGREVSPPEGMMEAVRIGQQEVYKLAAVRTGSQSAAFCLIPSCAFPVSVPDHDAATASV